MTTRDALRSKIFTSKPLKKKSIDFFGSEIELRQSDFGSIIDAKEVGEGRSALLGALIDNAYIPGTEEKVFEDTDIEALKALPFGADFIRVSKALEELSEVNFLGGGDTSKVEGTSTS